MIDIIKAKKNCRVDHDDEDDLFNDWLDEAELVIKNDLGRNIIFSEDERELDTDILDNKWLDSARLIWVEYRYSRSDAGKPQAYTALIQKFRIMGV